MGSQSSIKSSSNSYPPVVPAPIELEAFDQEPNLCVIQHLKAYMYVDKTSVHRGDTNRNQLQKPFQPVSKDTISCWIKNDLKDAGIDTTKALGQHPSVLLPRQEPHRSYSGICRIV